MTGVLPFDWRWWTWQQYYISSPRNAEIQNKVVADCSTPISTLSENYWARRYATSPGIWLHSSLTHWLLMPEIYPYLESYSSWDCCFWNWGAMNFFFANMYIGRKSAGQVNPLNPRTAWAHKIVLWMTLARLNAAWAIGVCGFFYTYEFLYKYVPGTRIRDPSPEGWKKPWQEDQSTFIARGIAATVFTPFAWYAWKGTWKRSGFLTGMHVFIQEYYELGRWGAHNGSVRALYYQASRDADKYERHGSLTPETMRTVDISSGKPNWAFSYETMRMNHGESYVLTQNNKNHDYQPMNPYGANIPNPYYDFQKAAQMDRPFLAKFKSETWKHPQVLSTRMMSGALDTTMAAA